jgi:hypothetical protein
MTTLNNLLGALTGPRRLRSVLRQKTVAISSLLVALDGPAELRATIPAAVFGGDIFGVMSTQLRDALIVPPPPVSVSSRPHRRQSVALLENSFAKHSENSSPPATRLKQSALTSEPLAVAQARSFQNAEGSSSEPQASGAFSITENLRRAQAPEHALETSVVTRLQSIEPGAASTARLAPAAPALVNSLNRYWQAVREARDTRHSHSQVLAETPANTVSFPVADSEQSAAPRAWPTAVERDVPQKLRSFADVNVPLKSRLASAPDHQTQNVFNTEVNHADHQSSNYDDLGDRLAQILHEQALQHGIDVT